MSRLEVDTEGWPEGTNWAEAAGHALTATKDVEPLLANPRLSVSVLFTTDEEVRALNGRWRGKEKATNVLSFPMVSRAELAVLSPEGPPEMLGDIALAYETCAAEAAEKGVPLEHHAVHLLIHGFLHLAGHDHGEDDQANTMERLEITALAKLGIADPYGNS